MNREVLQQALEALEYHTAQTRPIIETMATINVIKEVLAQQEQEPVAFYNPREGGFYWAKPTTISAPLAGDIVPLALYTSPLKREWVGLTDDEIKAIVGPWGSTEIKGYTRKLFDQIEAALKEKNQ